MIYWDLQFSVIAVILLVEKVKKYLYLWMKREKQITRNTTNIDSSISLLDKIFSLIQMSISWTTGAIWILALSFSNLKTATFSALQWKGKVNAISVWSLLFHAGQKGSSECLMSVKLMPVTNSNHECLLWEILDQHIEDHALCCSYEY